MITHGWMDKWMRRGYGEGVDGIMRMRRGHAI